MSMLTAPAHAPLPGHDDRPVRRPAPRPVERPARGERPSHLRVVRPDEQPGARSLRRLTPATGVVLTAVLFIVLFAVAGAQSLLVQGQVRLDAAEKQLTAEQARYQALRKDLAQMASPERVVAAAHEQGMVTPSDLVYLQPADAPTATTTEDVPLPGAADRGWSSVKPLLDTPQP
jgi:cell division protein FtsL